MTPTLPRSTDAGPFTRIVDRVTLFPDPVEAGALLERVVNDHTRYLVLDLDRTIHRGRNIGELLGWEIIAHMTFGEGFLDEVEAQRGPSRFVFDPRRPWANARYLALGARLWAFPGLLYLFAVKWGLKGRGTRRWVYRYFGPEPVAAVQEVPRLALLHHMSGLSIETLRRLARRVWRRYVADQVFHRADFDALRQRHPGLRIVISSASPEPVLDVAREELGIDDVIFTQVPTHEGHYAAPPYLSRLLMLPDPPRRVATPDAVRHNAAEAKIGGLLERYPDFLDTDVETVGITDTGYGEDHAWAGHFTRVVDVNSTTPFSPVVPVTSPLREIWSAQVRTPNEPEADGPPRPPRHVTGHELAGAVNGYAESLEALTAAYHRHHARVDEGLVDLDARIAAMQGEVGDAVERYNDAPAAMRPTALRDLRRVLGRVAALRRARTRDEAPLSALREAITWRQAACRRALDGLPAQLLNFTPRRTRAAG